MKINDLSHNINKIGNLETAAKKQKEEETSVNPTTATSVQSGERVELSNTSVGYSNAAEKMEEAPKDRTDKIESLKMKISDGTYNVDSRKIAEKIIKDSLFTALEP
jgi:negative regulator of flagellin synthesis FlgM